jgi:hypothetical protein
MADVNAPVLGGQMPAEAALLLTRCSRRSANGSYLLAIV